MIQILLIASVALVLDFLTIGAWGAATVFAFFALICIQDLRTTRHNRKVIVK